MKKSKGPGSNSGNDKQMMMVASPLSMNSQKAIELEEDEIDDNLYKWLILLFL